ncbi:MAG: alpha/beta fold hydrolase [Hyphomicrobium sp.]
MNVLAASAAGAVTLGDVSESEIRNAKPGQIVRVWPQEGGAPQNAKAYRILYRSTGLKGEPIAVSGAVIFFEGEAPRGGRPVVAWAHPTTGVVNRCAPTLLPDLSGTIAGLEEMLDRGYVIAATDYPGLGTPGINPYLIGVSEGRSVLDSVRAARELPDAKAQRRFAVWGHSQGGQAALFTGELAAEYAPELELVGVAAAAPATYLAQLFDADHTTTAGKTLTAMALLSWSKVFDVPLDSILKPNALRSFERVARNCIQSIADLLKIEQDTNQLETNFLAANPTKVEPWASIMTRNSPGKAPAGAPVFIAQGTADTIVRPTITRRFANHLCLQGTRVHMIWLEGVSHSYAGDDSALAAVRWMSDRFAGRPAPSNCGR